MRSLLSLVVAAAFCAPVAAQTAAKSDVVLGSRGSIAFMVSSDKIVESRVAYAGYIITKADLDATNSLEYSDGYTITEKGLYFDASVHGPSGTTPWESCDRDLEWAVKWGERRGKKKAQAELSDLADRIGRVITTFSARRNVDAQKTQLESIKARIPTATEGILQLIVARDLDKLEASLYQ